jgi:hypothetical protein
MPIVLNLYSRKLMFKSGKYTNKWVVSLNETRLGIKY